MEKVKLLTRISSFQDTEKAFQELEKTLNQLKQSVNTEAEGMVSDTQGKSGDIRLTQQGDKGYLFEIRTEDGWKTPVIGDSAVTFKDKPAFINKERKKSITEIETEDTSTGNTKAKKTIYDEKADKFILPRPDYDSGWTAVGTTALSHNLETTQFSMCQISHNNAADNSSHQINNLNIATVTTNGENAITVAFPGTQLSYYRVRLWK